MLETDAVKVMKNTTFLVFVIVVAAAATMLTTYCAGPKTAVGQEKPGTPISLTKDEAANWKKYRNEQLGFEFRYPETWVLRKEVINVTPGEPLTMFLCSSDYKERWEYRGEDWPDQVVEKGSSFSIGILSGVDLLPHSYFERLKSDTLRNNALFSLIKEANVGGQTALYRIYKTLIPENASLEVYFFAPPTHKSLLFVAYMQTAIGEKDLYFSIFDKILSTFRFSRRPQ